MSQNVIQTTLYIENMTCVHCENTIEHALIGIVGVEDVKASYSSGTVTISYCPKDINLEKVEELIREHDYYVKRDNSRKINTSKDKSVDITNIISIGIIIFGIYVLSKHLGLLDIFNEFPIAKEGMGYGMLFMIGLLTSVHCVAMCGGICITQCASKQGANFTKTGKIAAMRPSLLYNLGRIISYTVIGGIVGALGSVVSLSGDMKGMVQIVAGIFMVIMGINMLQVFPWLRKVNPRMPKIFAEKIYNQRTKNNSPLVIGLLNGLMPCGPLQAMQLYALSTGSPIKGAISMFLFSVGTVPLMFAFGALSTFLSKKFEGKMMKFSGVLVLVLGVFMFQSGTLLSGLTFSQGSLTADVGKTTNQAVMREGIQTVTTGLSPGSYEPIVVKKGIPVKWIIQAESGDINGCNNSIIIPEYMIEKDLSPGDTVIEFTPKKSGTFPFSCWMGMIRSEIIVVDSEIN